MVLLALGIAPSGTFIPSRGCFVLAHSLAPSLIPSLVPFRIPFALPPHSQSLIVGYNAPFLLCPPHRRLLRAVLFFLLSVLPFLDPESFPPPLWSATDKIILQIKHFFNSDCYGSNDLVLSATPVEFTAFQRALQTPCFLHPNQVPYVR